MKTPATKTTLAQSLATVSASLAATVAGTHAATVQITLTGNKLTMSTNTLNADVTGDGNNDVVIGGVNQINSQFNIGVNLKINGGSLGAGYHHYGTFRVDAQIAAGGVGKGWSAAYLATRQISYLNPITFTDARINGGASTEGYLEVNAFNSSRTNHTVALTRLVFDDSSTTLGTGGLSTLATYTEWTPAVVPEPSSLALLALGAGGLAVRRRRQVA